MPNNFKSARIEKPWMRTQYRYHEEQSKENALICVEPMRWNGGWQQGLIRRNTRKELEDMRMTGNRINNVAHKYLAKQIQNFIYWRQVKLRRKGLYVPNYEQDVKFEVLYLVSPMTITNGRIPEEFKSRINPEYQDCRGIAIIKYLTIVNGEIGWNVVMCVNKKQIGCVVNNIYESEMEEDHKSETIANTIVSSCVSKLMDSGYSFADDAYNIVSNID